MPFDWEELYHGAALTRIVEHPLFTSLNSGGQRGVYRINHDTLYVKYSTSPGDGAWRFTFNPDHHADCQRLHKAIRRAGQGRLWIALICVDDGVCLIDYDQYMEVTDPPNGDTRWISVERPRNASYRVTGPAGRLEHPIPMNAFPSLMFDK